jgi:hypothetical protein
VTNLDGWLDSALSESLHGEYNGDLDIGGISDEIVDQLLFDLTLAFVRASYACNNALNERSMRREYPRSTSQFPE